MNAAGNAATRARTAPFAVLALSLAASLGGLGWHYIDGSSQTRRPDSTTPNPKTVGACLPAIIGRGLPLPPGQTAAGSGDPALHPTVATAREAARTVPFEALRLAADLPAGPERDSIVVLAIAQWAALDPEAAARWAVELADPRLQERALAAVAGMWAEKAPAAAAALAMGALHAGPERDAAVLSIVQNWARQAPGTAAEWLQLMPAGDLRNSGLNTLIVTWGSHDPASCGKWLNQLAPGSERDNAVAIYIDAIAGLSPSAAARWAETIAHDAARTRACTAVARIWFATDAPAAEAWLTPLPLREPTKSRLLALGQEFPPGWAP